jgi:hypothetical protein
MRQVFFKIGTTAGWIPSITVADRAARRIGKRATQQDRRIRLLNGLGPSLHGRDLDDPAVVFSGRFGPDHLHGLHLLAHLLHAGSEIGAVSFDLLDIPAAADAEQQPVAGNLVN